MVGAGFREHDRGTSKTIAFCGIRELVALRDQAGTRCALTSCDLGRANGTSVTDRASLSHSVTQDMLVLNATVANCTLRRSLQHFLSRPKSSASIKPEGKMSFEEEKKKFLNMPSEEKKTFYKGEVTSLEQVPTWSEYWSKNKFTIAIKTPKKTEEVDEDLAKKVSMWQGDITSLEIDAIVNAANSSLLGGGGVDGAIHRAAGPNLKKECTTLKGCRVGEAKITGGYMLPAKYVIHTVGPQGEKPDKLKECYENSLAQAKENNLRTIAFPCISTGIYGYPQKPAAKVALSTVKKFLLENKDNIDRVIFCLFLKSDKDIYEELLQKYFAVE
ncbi:ADP-ribose glycohydrolase MACROD2-like [Odontomachus brunneus]|uniref:ADP-ribose glycohydrolase MACROD2-like n=1 Tax=Odontomachus brunneus TaxID=486640 RepID=UPI0013F198D4|nr:ADP-ribose glycohydrolase MACROD2-like [Odontomachus brunneus]